MEQAGAQCGVSRSYNPSEHFGGRESHFRPARLSENDNTQMGYNTFHELRNNSEEVRNRSVSLPYVTCGPRAIKRTLSSMYSNDVVESSAKLNSVAANGSDPDSSDESSLAEESNTEQKKSGFTKKQYKVMVALCVLSIVDTMGFGVFAPFFPIVAEEKHLSEVQIGFVFASFSMAGIFGSIFTGTLLVQVGAKFIILSGMFWCAGATVCFGLLDQAPEEYFFWLCCACRVFMGIGSSSAFTALFAVIFQEFGDKSLTVIGISESLCTIGGMVGPLLGGGLYKFGLSAVMIGVYLLIFSISYGISTPIFGRISDAKDIGAHLMTLCCFLSGIVLSLFGPADFWMNWFGWDKPHIWLVIVCMIFQGTLMGGLIMPTFGEMVIAAKQMKLHENELAQYGLVSGLWNTVFSVGDILGPTMGGAISAERGFNNTLAILGACMIVLALLKTVHLVYLSCKRRDTSSTGDPPSESDDDDETRSLLGVNYASIQA